VSIPLVSSPLIRIVPLLGNEAVNHLQGGGLPAAGRAEQDAHFPFGHVQVDVVDGLKGLAVLL
jgi:hypothetical protein